MILSDYQDFLNTPIEEQDASPITALQPGQMDPRYLRTSYSALLDLHACPRYYQLSRLEAEKLVDSVANVTFAYGHAVGEGIQQFLITKDLDKAVWAMFLMWHADLFEENEKQKKSFFTALAAVMQFAELCKDGLFEDYEVAYFNGKPAAELSFRIHFPNTTYRGYVDLVLRHVITGELLVLELKTSSANYVNHFQYKNSAQAIGYSVILDKIEPGCTSYSVQYLVQMTKLGRFEPFEFPKTMHQRALWIEERLWDEEIITGLIARFGNYGNWPTHGESCTRFGRTCSYMDMCHMPTESLMAPLRLRHFTDMKKDAHGIFVETVYDFEINVEELLV